MFAARLQVLTLSGDAFALIFDQWDGPRLTDSAIKSIKAETGARGVLFFGSLRAPSTSTADLGATRGLDAADANNGSARYRT